MYQFPLHRISYCADDKGAKKYFSFIAKGISNSKDIAMYFYKLARIGLKKLLFVNLLIGIEYMYIDKIFLFYFSMIAKTF